MASSWCLLSLALTLHWMLPQTSETVRLIMKGKRSWCKSEHVTTTLENATNKWLASMHIKIQRTKTWNMWNAHAFSVAKRSLPSKTKRFNMCFEEKNKNLPMLTPKWCPWCHECWALMGHPNPNLLVSSQIRAQIQAKICKHSPGWLDVNWQ